MEEETVGTPLKHTMKDIMFTLYGEEAILRRHDKTVAEAAARKAEQRGIEQDERDKYAAMMAWRTAACKSA